MLAEAAYRDAAGMPRTAAWARAIAGRPGAVRAHPDRAARVGAVGGPTL